MILVSVQYTDKPNVADAIYNGGFGIQFYDLIEAKAFARSESTPLVAASARTCALCRVYDGGALVEAWEDGVNITP